MTRHICLAVYVLPAKLDKNGLHTAHAAPNLATAQTDRLVHLDSQARPEYLDPLASLG